MRGAGRQVVTQCSLFSMFYSLGPLSSYYFVFALSLSLSLSLSIYFFPFLLCLSLSCPCVCVWACSTSRYIPLALFPRVI